MPRSYDVRIAALAVGVDVKWIDNFLSRFPVPGVERSRQGVQRRISDDALLAILLARILSSAVGLSLAVSARYAAQALAEHRGTDVRVWLAQGIDLRIDLATLDQALRQRLTDAVDAAPRVRRGRPPLETRTPGV